MPYTIQGVVQTWAAQLSKKRPFKAKGEKKMAKKGSKAQAVVNPIFGDFEINVETIRNWVAEETAQREHDVSETVERSVCCVTGGAKEPKQWVSDQAFRAAQKVENGGGGQMLVDQIKEIYVESGGDLHETEGFDELVAMIASYLSQFKKASEEEVLDVAKDEEVLGSRPNWVELEKVFSTAFRKAGRMIKAIAMRERYEAKKLARPLAEDHYRQFPADLDKKVSDIVAQALVQKEAAGIEESIMKSALWEVQSELNKARPEHARVTVEKHFRANPGDLFRKVRDIADEIAPGNDPGMLRLMKYELFHQQKRLLEERRKQKAEAVERHKEVVKTWFETNQSNDGKVVVGKKIYAEMGDDTLQLGLLIDHVEEFRVREKFESHRSKFKQSIGEGTGLEKWSFG